MFVRGKDFAIAIYKGNLNNSIFTMLIGRNMAPKRTILLDFADIVVEVELKRKDIISPRCDDSCELSREI